MFLLVCLWLSRYLYWAAQRCYSSPSGVLPQQQRSCGRVDDASPEQDSRSASPYHGQHEAACHRSFNFLRPT